MNVGEQFHVSLDAVFRVIEPNRVRVVVRGSSHNIHIDLYRLVLAFATPRTIAEVHADLDTDASPAEIREALDPLLRCGALVVVKPASEEVSLATILNPQTFADPRVMLKVGAAVAEGRAVLIPRAFDDALAERVHLALEHCTRWQREGSPASEYFHYQQHSIRDPADFPEELAGVERVLGSTSTKKYLSGVTESDCTGPLMYSASLYLPGDYSLPHSDAWGARTVSYIWYLAKDWKPEWGGHFVWCPTGAIFSPMFNALVLFRADARSIHCVSQVSPYAQGRRISINGSWQAAADLAFPTPVATKGLSLLAGEYNGGSQSVDGTDLVLL